VYLPFTLGAPIFAGGAVRHLVDRYVNKKYPEEAKGQEEVDDWEAVVKKKGLSMRDKITQKGLISRRSINRCRCSSTNRYEL